MMFTTGMFHFIKKKNTNIKVNYYPEKKFSLLLKKNKRKIINPIYMEKNDKKNNVLLTFDDGYKDHYNIYKKFLKSKPSLFFLNGKVFEKKDFLDVNKIQIIANNFKSENLLYLVEELVNKFSKKRFYVNSISNKGTKYRPLDTKNTSILKYIFQIYLPFSISSKILNLIFYDFLKINHKKLFKEFYLNLDQALEMKKNGMIFGNHTYNHYPLTRLKYKDQFFEIKKNHDILQKYDLLDDNFFSYPYGLYNKNTLKILKKLNYKFAFTIKKNKSNLNNPLKLSRMDANFL